MRYHGIPIIRGARFPITDGSSNMYQFISITALLSTMYVYVCRYSASIDDRLQTFKVYVFRYPAGIDGGIIFSHNGGIRDY